MAAARKASFRASPPCPATGHSHDGTNMSTFIDSLRRFTRSPSFKFFLIGGLLLLLGIPLALVWLAVSEREGRATGVRNEVAQLWGREQAVSGPYLIVPYTIKVMVMQGDKPIEQLEERRAVFLPESFNVTGDTKSEVRKRSIYEVTVYTAKTRLEGRFATPDIRLAAPNAASVRWRDAIIALSLTDVSGLKEAAVLVVDGKRRIAFEPSIGVPGIYTQGINAQLASQNDQPPAPFTFEADLTFTGSSTLSFAPVGRETKVQVKSDWPHPSFMGAFLPEARDIRADGFTATWRVPHLARSVPQAWSIGELGHADFERFSAYAFGVNYFVPVDYYNLVDRAAKYGLLFLTVAFLSVFVLELTSGTRVHAVQYVFVGLSMILFYVLLLSFAEHIGFTAAYFAASGATGGTLSLYVGKAMRSRGKGLIMLSIFLILYSLLYLILRLEDYALLAGAVAGFAMLTITMFATLRVHWSGEEVSPNTRQQAG